MLECLPREKKWNVRRVAALGTSPGFFQTDDGSVFHTNNIVNLTGREPAIDDCVIRFSETTLLIGPDVFDEWFETVDPIKHLENVDDQIASCEFIKSGSMTISIIKLHDETHITGSVAPPLHDFLTEEEGQELSFLDARQRLVELENYRISRRLKAQRAGHEQAV